MAALQAVNNIRNPLDQKITHFTQDMKTPVVSSDSAMSVAEQHVIAKDISEPSAMHHKRPVQT